MPSASNPIAVRLARLRTEKGWTLKEAAKATLDLFSPSRISNYEQGIREVGINEAKVLAKAYKTSAAHLLCLDDDNPVLSPMEREHIRNLRALPENQRNDYVRRVHALALAYKDPVADERLPDAFAKPDAVAPKRRRKVL